MVESKRAELHKRGFASVVNGGDSTDGDLGNVKKRPTLMEVLIEASDSEAGSLTTYEVVCNLLAFVAAGVDTTSTTLTHIAVALAKHPRVQQKLYDEISKSSV